MRTPAWFYRCRSLHHPLVSHPYGYGMVHQYLLHSQHRQSPNIKYTYKISPSVSFVFLPLLS
jgi:hypothetical protein